MWIRQVSTASSVEITPPTAGRSDALAFSPDGEAVLYVFSTSNAPFPSLFRIPVLGGPPRKLVEDISTAPAFSPDGKRIAFIRSLAGGARALVLANADGTGQRRLASRAGSDAYEITRVAWSPDGTQIAAFAGEMPAQQARVVLVNVDTGREQEFSDARFDSGGALTWLGDGSALVFDAIEKYGGRWNWNSKLWSIAYPAGTSAGDHDRSRELRERAATAGGRTLVAVPGRDARRPLGGAGGRHRAGQAHHRHGNGAEGATGLGFTPDGRIVYSAITQNSWDIWIANGDGSQAKQLTSRPGCRKPATGAALGCGDRLHVPRVGC